MRKKIGECLIQAGLITDDDLQVALAEHKRTGERVGAVLVRLNLATEKQITKALAYQLGFPYTSLRWTTPPIPRRVLVETSADPCIVHALLVYARYLSTTSPTSAC